MLNTSTEFKKIILILSIITYIFVSPMQNIVKAESSDSLELTAGIKHLVGVESFVTVVNRSELPVSAQFFTKITVQSSNAPFYAKEIGINEFIGRPEPYSSTGYGSGLPSGGNFYVLTTLFDDNRNPLGYHETMIQVPGANTIPQPSPEPQITIDNNSSLGYGEEFNGMPNTISIKFTDVLQDHWAFKSIGDMSTRGVLAGYPDGKFRPEKIVTRAEFAKIMVLAAGLEPVKVANTSFADIKATDWFAPYVEAAKGYLTGYSLSNGKTNYNPNSPALREDIAVAIVKLKGYDKNRLADLSIIEAMFRDYDGISDIAKKYVALAVENKLVSGFPDDTFRPQEPVTRAQAAAMLWRAYQFGNDNKLDQESKVEIPSSSTVTESTYTN